MALSDPWHLLTGAPAGQAYLYPPFKAKVEQLLINCAARGYVFFVSSGCRTVAEQDALYAQGRTKPGKVVTNAKGGQSAHQYRIACDLTHDADNNASNGLQPAWDDAAYLVLAEEAVKLGLESGARWKFADKPHVQLPLDAKGIKMFLPEDIKFVPQVTADVLAAAKPTLLYLLKVGGHDTVFKYLDNYSW